MAIQLIERAATDSTQVTSGAPFKTYDGQIHAAEAFMKILRIGGRWTQSGRYEGEAKVRAAPFDVIELELGTLWI